MRLAPHDGQNPRRLQLKATSLSCPQSPQRRRRKPWVRFVKAAQRLGFSLDEVAGLLTLDDGAHCDDARQLAELKLADVRGKLVDLRRIEKVLAALVRECCTSHSTVSCPLIATLQKQ